MTRVPHSRSCACRNVDCSICVRDILPKLIGHVAQQIAASGALSVVISFEREEREAAVLGQVFVDRLTSYERRLTDRHINRPHAIVTSELSADRRANFHMVVHGVDLKKRSLRQDWSRSDAPRVEVEPVSHPLELAAYVSKTALIGILQEGDVGAEILGFVRNLHGGTYARQINTFIDPELATSFHDLSAEVMAYARRKRGYWLAEKMPPDVTDAIRRATQLKS